MPKNWTSATFKPLELEEYLRDKWRAQLALEVLQVSQMDLWWLDTKKTNVPIKSGTLCRVPGFPHTHVQEKFLPDFLVCEPSNYLLKNLPQVFFYKHFKNVYLHES